jgi:hypothetical protein
MRGPESLPFRPGGAKTRKPETSSGSKIFQPTDSRQFGPGSAIERRRAGTSRRMEEAVVDQRSQPQSPSRATRDGSAIDYVLRRPAVLVGSAGPGASTGSVM